MKNIKQLTVPLIITVFLVHSLAFAQDGGTSEEAAAKKTIRTLHEQVNEALSRGDLESVMSVYEKEVISMPPNQPPLVGKPAVRDMWEGLLEIYSIDASVQVKEVEIAGKWAYESGAYRMTLIPKEGGEAIKDEGKYLDIVRQQPDGSWKYARVSWSSNLQ